MKHEGFKISKESVEKLFPKRDFDILGYESPITLIIQQLTTDFAQKRDEAIWEAVFNEKVAVDIDKDELIKALRYDRGQYEQGYAKGYYAGYNANKWISVEDRLPDIHTSYIVALKTKYPWESKWNYDTDVALYNGDGVWETWNDWDEGNEVIITHWMPLPEHPREREDI